ncbi:MAG: class II glutamine amidotransferase [Elusimicrobia bacterium]|nr:class II glutamine amidotransferase [Elusimicrobiota bacterium]
MFGQLTLRKESALTGLIEAPFSMLRLSDADRKRPQKDGWGVAWVDAAGKTRVLKSPRPIYEEGPAARLAAQRCASTALLGHIRAASNPKGLAAPRVMGLANTQPFGDGRWAFAHNGTLQIPDAVAARLGARRRRLKGVNDSEVYFQQFLKFLAQVRDPAEALAACARETVEVWRAARRDYPSKSSPFTGLNAVVVGRDALLALSLYPSPDGPRSIGRGSQPWGTMSLRVAPDRVVVASEDLDAGRWRRLAPGTLVSARRTGGRLLVELRRLGKEVYQ